jgi:hypothetical protein
MVAVAVNSAVGRRSERIIGERVMVEDPAGRVSTEHARATTRIF